MSKKSRKTKAAKAGKTAKKAQNSQFKGDLPLSISGLSHLKMPFPNKVQSRHKELVAKLNPTKIAINIDQNEYQIYFVTEPAIYNLVVDPAEITDLLTALSKGTVVAFEEVISANWLGRTCQSLGLEPHMMPVSLVREITGVVGGTPAEKAEAIYNANEQLSQDPEGHKKLCSIKTEDDQAQSFLNAQLVSAKADVDANERNIAGSLKDLGYDVTQIPDLASFARALILEDPIVHKYVLEQAQATGSTVDDRTISRAEDDFFRLSMQEYIKLSVPTRLLPLLFNYTYYLKSCSWSQGMDMLFSKAMFR